MEEPLSSLSSVSRSTIDANDDDDEGGGFDADTEEDDFASMKAEKEWEGA